MQNIRTGHQTVPTSPTKVLDANFERPRRASSMALTPGVGAPPQPSGNIPSQPVPFQHPEETVQIMRSGSSSTLAMDGIEPKIFPGVVSRRRRSSLRSGSAHEEYDAEHTAHAHHSGFRRSEGAVMEEDDTDDELGN